MPLYIAQSGDLDRCYRCLTHSQTLKDIATQLLTKYKSGALVTQIQNSCIKYVKRTTQALKPSILKRITTQCIVGGSEKYFCSGFSVHQLTLWTKYGIQEDTC